jgi:hypothetical protein
MTEALAYLGAALAAAAAAVLLGGRWEELAPAARATAIGAGAVIALAAGFALRRSEEPAFVRTTSVLWFVGTGLTAWFVGLVAGDVLAYEGRVPLLAGGLAAIACGGILFALRRRGLQQIALLAGLVTVGAAAFEEAPAAPTAAWAIGVVWVLAAMVGQLRPARPAYGAGSLVALYAPVVTTSDEGWGLWLGLGTATAVLAASVWRREPIMLGLGGVGLFGYLVGVLADRFGGTAAMPIALLLAGAVVFALALGYARRSGRAAIRTAPRSPS